jgi:PKD repeat protein
VAACLAACGAWDDKADGVAATAKTVNHTYDAVGTYTPKIIAERSSLAANGDTAVTVSAAPTLSVDLVAAPNSGNAPLATVLTATVSGSATGSINYTTWFNCDDPCATVAACLAACGAWDDKADGVAATAKTVNHTYDAVGTYTPKIIVERDSLTAGDSNTVTVTSGGGPATLSVDVIAAPDFGPAPLNITLTGTVSGTAAGTINYTTWWDCDDPCATVAACLAACGAWDDKEDGSNFATKTLNHSYAAAGIYTPKMIVERDSLTAGESVVVNVSIGNDPPTADTLTKQNDFCASGLATMFSWNYSDPENDSQAYRQVQVDDDADFSSPADDSGKTATASDSYVTLASKLQYDTAYYWRLKVWDSKGNESDWIDGSDFTMPLHSYPEIAFNLSPETPKVDDIVIYTDDTQVFGGATISSRSWIIEAATPNTSVAGVVEVVYAVKGNYTTKLTITDSNGYTCALEKPIKVKGRIPDWDEI